VTIKTPQEINMPNLALRYCTSDEYCMALQKMKGLGFWWYQDPSNKNHAFSRPFLSKGGIWWYQVKPGLAWPVNILTPLNGAALAFGQKYLGCQYRTENLGSQNSYLIFNVIENVKSYTSASIDDKRRAAIRKGLRLCNLHVVDRFEKNIFNGSLKAWNDLVSRTGWKKKLNYSLLEESWKKMLDMPGSTIIVGLDSQTGDVAGFIIVKVIEHTAYIDTIASSNAMARLNINDLLIYSFLMNAKKIFNVQYSHYGLLSSVENLEKFKRSLGFKPQKYPATTRLTPGVGLVLKTFFPAKYNRLFGYFNVNRKTKNPETDF
jgi:hypothetical protein